MMNSDNITLHYRKATLSYVVFAMMMSSGLAHAEDKPEQVTQLATIYVKAEQQQQIAKNKQITSNQDLVRNSTDLGVLEIERFGNRGFTIRGVDGNRVAITVDGVAQADSEGAAYSGGHGITTSYNTSRLNVDTELMSEVKVNKGSDAEAGSGALGGSVNYQTKTVDNILLEGRKTGAYLKHTFNGRNIEWINTVGGAFDTKYVDGLVLYSHRKGHETQINVKDNGALGDDRSLPNPYRHYQYSYLAKLGFKWNDEHRIELKADKQRGKLIGTELNYGWGGSLATNRKFYDIQEKENYGLNYIFTPNTSIIDKFKLGYNYQDTKISSRNPLFSRSTDREFRHDLHQGNANLSFKAWDTPIGQHRLATVLGYAQQKFIFTQDVPARPQSSFVDSPVTRKQWHFMMSDQIQWNPALFSNVHLRYDHVQHRDHNKSENAKGKFSVITGGMNFFYKFHPSWKVGIEFNRAFRIPTSTEMYYTTSLYDGNTGQISKLYPNPELKPETSNTYEVALQGNGKLGTLNFTAYHTQYKDLIERAEAGIEAGTNLTIIKPQNVDRAKITGIDTTAVLNLNRVIKTIPQGFNLNVGLGYANGEKANGEKLAAIQPLRTLFGLSYIAPQDDWSISLQGQYSQAKKAKDTLYYQQTQTGYSAETAAHLSPSYTVFDLYGHKNFGKNTVVTLGVYNLFNRKYKPWDNLRFISKSEDINIERYNAPERYVKASVEFKF